MPRVIAPLVFLSCLLALAAGSLVCEGLAPMARAASAPVIPYVVEERDQAPQPSRLERIAKKVRAAKEPAQVQPSEAKVQAPSGAPVRPTVRTSSRSPYAVQIASFRTERRAEALAASLRARGLTAQVQMLRGRGVWYVVRSADQPGLDEARDEARKVERVAGVRTLVKRFTPVALADGDRLPARDPGAGEAEARLKRAGVQAVVGAERSAGTGQANTRTEAREEDWLYMVQAAGFNEPAPARVLAADLSARGMGADILYLHGWYVVQAGAFPDRDEARARADAVRAAIGREPTIRAATRRTIQGHVWTPGPDEQAGPRPGELDLAYRIDTTGRKAPDKSLLVAAYKDPREAGGQVRRLRAQGVAAQVAFHGGSEPWGVYRGKDGQ